MKIKCLRFECEICSKLSSIQVFYDKTGEIKYAGTRHYTGAKDGKPQFEYHQQSIEFAQRKLYETSQDSQKTGHIGQEINIDLIKPNLSSNCEEKVRSPGFEPGIISLEG